MGNILKIEDVAATLRISYMKARSLILDGEIPHYRVGARGIRVDSEVLDKYIQTMRNESKTTIITRERSKNAL